MEKCNEGKYFHDTLEGKKREKPFRYFNISFDGVRGVESPGTSKRKIERESRLQGLQSRFIRHPRESGGLDIRL